MEPDREGDKSERGSGWGDITHLLSDILDSMSDILSMFIFYMLHTLDTFREESYLGRSLTFVAVPPSTSSCMCGFVLTNI